jgi:hypothetical protein
MMASHSAMVRLGSGRSSAALVGCKPSVDLAYVAMVPMLVYLYRIEDSGLCV